MTAAPGGGAGAAPGDSAGGRAAGHPDSDGLPPASEIIGGRAMHPNARRATVVNCPFCASENLFPDAETDNAWQCRDCCRVFSVKLHGYLPRGVTG
ncbi:hypothetical protein [Corynebacterium bovis]|uniref:hypothetical protein n=1 Tax=Corynebacterium bovis TaxID=36808 RepID=UPI002653A930|nr:hypothetical protein [Corynebacterium bovis]MDN8578750.1 hypothetical protein [Corynebacterium bovis]